MTNKNCFDFLRFAFAINIFLAHLSELSQSEKLFFLSNYTDAMIGVRGFFVISGFLVAKSYVNTNSLKTYFVKRAKRILPAYFVVIIVATLGLALVSSYSFVEYFSSSSVYKYFGWNIVFLNFMQPCLPGIFDNNLLCSVNGALWTLKIEEGFYILLPFIFYFFRKTKKPFYILLGLYLFSLLYSYMMGYLGKPLLGKQLPGQLTYFIVGIYLFMNFAIFIKYKYELVLISATILFVLWFFNVQIDIIYPLLFGLLLIGGAYCIPFLNDFGKYGDFTYGIYIFHFPIIQIFRGYNMFEMYDPFLVAIVVFCITIIIAIISWFVVEKRFIARFKKTSKNLVYAN